MIMAVVFDVDGVLVDSQAANARFFKNLLRAAGYDTPGAAEIQAYFHLSMYDAIARLTKSDDPGEIERIWKLGHDSSLYPVELLEYPSNLKKILQQLEPNYRLGIATSRIRKGMKELLERGGIQGYFKTIITFDDYKHPKPAPEPLLLAVERLNVPASAAVYVGDSNNDIIAALAAGMMGIHLSETPNPQADIGIRTIAELPDAVQRLACAAAG
jgi:HAD superfamily hydrolase (TIGR01509 family)